MFRDALSRTKNKFKKDEKTRDATKDEQAKDFTLSQDVNDFLAAGKVTASIPNAEPQYGRSAEPWTTNQQRPQLSPQRVPAPQRDVPSSLGLPDTSPVGDVQGGAKGGNYDLLQPGGHVRRRSQSSTSATKKKSRPRNLSVSFDSRPPVIIGLGGDEAEQPPSEISRLWQRRRGVSPDAAYRPGSSHSHSSQNSTSSTRRKPLPQANKAALDDDFGPPRLLQRVQTGFNTIQSPAEREYELSLKMAPLPDGRRSDSGFKTAVISPTPIHPPTAPPRVQSPPSSLSPPPSSLQQPSHQLPAIHSMKQGTVQVTITDEESIDREPTLPNVSVPSKPQLVSRAPTTAVRMPHQQFAHRPKPSLNETETMDQGAGGWL